jgi:hypothetical protein
MRISLAIAFASRGPHPLSFNLRLGTYASPEHDFDL